MRLRPSSALLPLAFALGLPASAQISLTIDRTWDWPNHLPFAGIGGFEIDPADGHLWISDSGNGNEVYEVDPIDFSVLSMLPTGLIPSMNSGPDSIALDPMTGNLHLFSIFLETEGAVVTQGGTHVSSFLPIDRPAGSAFSADGRLFTTTDTGSLRLHELDPSTHAILNTVQISGVSGRVTSMTIDPISGNVFMVAASGHILHEVDPNTGVSLASQSLFPSTAWGSFPGGIAFSTDGTELFVGDGTSGGSLELVVYDVGRGATNYCSTNPNSTGVAASMDLRGSTIVAQNSMALRAVDLPTNTMGIFLTSRTQGFVSMPGNSMGNLCLVGAIGRYVGPGQVQGSGTDGEIVLLLDLTLMPTPTGLVPAAAGETWNFQAWFRDAVGGASTSNFTDGLEVLLR